MAGSYRCDNRIPFPSGRGGVGVSDGAVMASLLGVLVEYFTAGATPCPRELDVLSAAVFLVIGCGHYERVPSLDCILHLMGGVKETVRGTSRSFSAWLSLATW